tara:strand:- start:90 stop:440 length:351 start_codon:yes stop_codon:yes gene_type:complete
MQMTEEQTIKLFVQQVLQALEVAEQEFNLDLSHVNVIVAGALVVPAKTSYEGDGTVLFNPEFILNHFDAMVENAIAHELAHIVVHHRPEYGSGHDLGWKKVKEHLESTAELVGSLS